MLKMRARSQQWQMKGEEIIEKYIDMKRKKEEEEELKNEQC